MPLRPSSPLTCMPGSPYPLGESAPQVRTKKPQSNQRLHEAWRLLNLGSGMHFSVVLAVVVPLAACTGDINDLRDASAGIDMAQPADDMTMLGGTTFAGQINQDVMTLGCTAAVCHGGTQTPVMKDNDIDNNYMNFKIDAMNGADSLVLTKNLMGSPI